MELIGSERVAGRLSSFIGKEVVRAWSSRGWEGSHKWPGLDWKTHLAAVIKLVKDGDIYGGEYNDFIGDYTTAIFRYDSLNLDIRRELRVSAEEGTPSPDLKAFILRVESCFKDSDVPIEDLL